MSKIPIFPEFIFEEKWVVDSERRKHSSIFLATVVRVFNKKDGQYYLTNVIRNSVIHITEPPQSAALVKDFIRDAVLMRDIGIVDKECRRITFNEALFTLDSNQTPEVERLKQYSICKNT